MSENEVVTVETNVLPVSANPTALLQMAVEKDFDVDRLSKLMELQQRWEDNQARKNFHAAMANFKKNPVAIVKDMHVEFGNTKYNHASLGNVVGTVTQALSEFDLSVNWETETITKVKVTCTVTHIDGYSKSTSIEAPADTSGSKNAIQAIGSAVTYLQRYTLLAILGLATNEFEDDGRSYNDKTPPPQQRQTSKNTSSKAQEEKNDLEIEKLEKSLDIPNLSSVHALAEKNWLLLNKAQKATLNGLFSKAEEMPEGACANWLKMINKEAE